MERGVNRTNGQRCCLTVSKCEGASAGYAQNQYGQRDCFCEEKETQRRGPKIVYAPMLCN